MTKNSKSNSSTKPRGRSDFRDKPKGRRTDNKDSKPISVYRSENSKSYSKPEGSSSDYKPRSNRSSSDRSERSSDRPARTSDSSRSRSTTRSEYSRSERPSSSRSSGRSEFGRSERPKFTGDREARPSSSRSEGGSFERPRRDYDKPRTERRSDDFRSSDRRPEGRTSSEGRSESSRESGRRSFGSSSSTTRSEGGRRSSFGSSSRGGFRSEGGRGRPSGSGRGSSMGGRGLSGRGRKKDLKKFDPSVFIKKVEEQPASSPAYIPKNTFSDFAINEQIKKNIASKGYKTPTPIQDEAIPHLLEGKDIIASANTGTGKTAAFLIPLVERVLSKEVNKVLIIAPTRELADQIQVELQGFKAKTKLTSALCIGGANMGYQIRQLRRNPEFVIGTPGRLMDLERNEVIDFSDYNAIVLDEVDTMLDMGFITDIKEIIAKLPTKRQSLFFSATIPPKLREVMDDFLNKPVTISVKTRQSAENVNQDIIKVGDKDKVELLHDLLNKPEFKKVIIFSRTKRATDKLSTILRDRGFKIATIHGDKSQAQRKRALEMLRDNKVKILLATDVVARGIDINDVTHVINYDLPQTHDDYIHRIGRTGRANKIGQAITFID